MPREIITVQCGQCGNQIGWRFWDLVLREHAAHNKGGVFDEAFSSFFRNVDTRFSQPADCPLGSPVSSLRARAVLVDTEEGVVGQLYRGPLAELFDPAQCLTDVSGAGNNWAHGHEVYGPSHREAFLEKVRRAAQHCDSLQCFSLLHSLGGGTGSGLGTYLLSALEDEYPNKYRFATSAFPAVDDDVITSPYNAVLAAAELVEHADAVFPVDNGALIDLVNRAEKPAPSEQPTCRSMEAEHGKSRASSQRTPPVTDNSATSTPCLASARPAAVPRQRAFDSMNNLVAHMLSNLTASNRFDGVRCPGQPIDCPAMPSPSIVCPVVKALNVDLSDLTSSLVPFPRLHFLLPALAPLYSLQDLKYRSARLDGLFSDAFAAHSQLTRSDPKHSTMLATGLLLRGDLMMSDVQRNLARLRPQLRLPYWNPDGIKVGICATPPVGLPHAVLALSNNCCMARVLEVHLERFDRLYRRKAHVHHFSQYVEASALTRARETLMEVHDQYARYETSQPSPEAQELLDRLVPTNMPT